ncbi:MULTISPECIES: aldo/keto reductase [unclassified Leifsonia]|uniref:aldo/keto reductase n=1 Tax=unclassified Leifsonia TaxID=2663824 RepID=UPI0006F347E3|nr:MULTISPECIES: aldo/keto reductase [unclassified Leifsonia]KQX05173.1 aldo/keto reductase [Leifsonia sp. Root1293]KRA08806.1 aldo/keto reductase [Leifsonia sp. Root60]
MLSRTLGSAVRLTELGMGAAQLGNLYRETTDAEAGGAVDAAWDAGIRYFDTAPHYGLGLSERRLGAALADRPRDEYVLSTKVGRLLVPSGYPEGTMDDGGFAVPATVRREWDLSRDGIRRSVHESLERLGLDRIDIAYLHDPDDFGSEAHSTAIPALIELRDEGVVRAVGAGTNQSAMPAEFVRRHDVDVIMLAGRYTLLEQGALDDLLPLAEERGVGIVAAAVYNSGLLSRPRPPAGALYDYAPAPAELIAKANAIADVCEEFGITLPEAAVAYPLRHPAVVSVVVGMRTAEQVRGTAERYERDIPEEFWTALDERGLVRRA